MSIPLIVFVATFALVGAKSFQQKNVIADKWIAIPPMSYIMAAGEYASIGLGAVDMVDHGLSRIFILILCSGTGGWLGCYAGMICHNKLFNNNE